MSTTSARRSFSELLKTSPTRYMASEKVEMVKQFCESKAKSLLETTQNAMPASLNEGLNSVLNKSNSRERLAAQSAEYGFKVVMVGDSAVGKTSVLNRLTENFFNNAFTPTIGIDFKLQVFSIDGKRVRLQIWDTAGQEKFKSITTSYYRSADGVMLFYDVSDKRSFQNVENWMKSVEECCSKQAVKMVIGNKSELYDNRQVQPNEGRAFAGEHDAAFYEVSAQTGINVAEAFTEMARLLKRRRDAAQADGPIAVDAAVLLDEIEVNKKLPCCKIF